MEKKPTEKDMEYLDKWTRRSAITHGISDDRLIEICNAERHGRLAVMPFIPGSEVWVIERDENGDPDCVSGFVFIASVNNAAFVHPYIAGNGEIEVILQDLLENTAEWQDCDMETYPIEDCYESYEAASIAMEGEQA